MAPEDGRRARLHANKLTKVTLRFRYPYLCAPRIPHLFRRVCFSLDASKAS